ncbi:MAG: hypothetical protein E7321_06980 [Clostridiales bacterium]|nr:hypothetical protein [Clostridiales bacterium]
MIKTMGRFALLVLLCLMFVYAPEILTAVSAPYAVSTPQRALLRIALCCEDEAAVSSLYKLLSAYQKAYPAVHLRVTRTAPDQLSKPYPDVVLCPDACSSRLPIGFSVLHPSPASDLLCAVLSDSESHKVASEFAAYLYEASVPQRVSSDF